MLLGIDRNILQDHLNVIEGLPLCFVRRAYEGGDDCFVFSFGKPTVGTDSLGRAFEVGQFGLHIQCPFNLTYKDEIALSSTDVYESDLELERKGSLDCELPGLNLFHERSETLFEEEAFIVRSISVDALGGLVIVFENEYILKVLPHNSKDFENWIFIETGTPSYFTSCGERFSQYETVKPFSYYKEILRKAHLNQGKPFLEMSEERLKDKRRTIERFHDSVLLVELEKSQEFSEYQDALADTLHYLQSLRHAIIDRNYLPNKVVRVEALELFIRSKEEFIQAKEMVSAVFDLEQRLPQQVFHSNYANFHFDEFDWAWHGQERYRDFVDPDRLFWDTVKEICVVTKDEFVILASNNLAETNKFHRDLGYYNWLRLPVDIDYEDVLEVISLEPEVEKWGGMLLWQMASMWVGPSLQWGIWGGRLEEMCVLGLREDADANSILPIVRDWLLAEPALPKSISPWETFSEKQEKALAAFGQELVENYSK